MQTVLGAAKSETPRGKGIGADYVVVPTVGQTARPPQGKQDRSLGGPVKQGSAALNDHKPGDRLVITDPRSAYYGQVGTVEAKGETGGLYLKHEDGRVVYHPWGYDIERK